MKSEKNGNIIRNIRMGHKKVNLYTRIITCNYVSIPIRGEINPVY